MEYRFPSDVDPMETVGRLIQRFQTEAALAIVGPHGTGKTTLLHHLIGQLRSHVDGACFHGVRFHRLNSSSQKFGPSTVVRWIESRTLVVIDGFEQLPVASRLAALAVLKCRRGGARLLVTAHRRQWMVPTFFSTNWQPDIVRDLTAEKIAHLPMERRIKMQQVAEKLVKQYRSGSHVGKPAVGKEKVGNVRDYWFALYDAYEELHRQGTNSP